MHKENDQVQRYSSLTRMLITGGAIGPFLFIVVLLLEGATRPAYSAWRDFGSLLSLGDQGWMQIANFLMCGILTLGFAVGLRQVMRPGKGALGGPLCFGIFGLALIIAGIFVTDPNLYYHPAGVTTTSLPTTHGAIHALAGLFTFMSLTFASVAMARRFAGDPAWRGWVLYSLFTGLVILAAFIASLAFSNPGHGALSGLSGLLQRVGIIAGWSWMGFLSLRLSTRMRPSTSSSRQVMRDPAFSL